MYFYELVGLVWPQEEKKERLRKTTFIILIDPRDRGAKHCRCCGRDSSAIEGRTQKPGEIIGPVSSSGFLPARQDKLSNLGLVSLSHFWAPSCWHGLWLPKTRSLDDADREMLSPRVCVCGGMLQRYGSGFLVYIAKAYSWPQTSLFLKNG